MTPTGSMMIATFGLKTMQTSATRAFLERVGAAVDGAVDWSGRTPHHLDPAEILGQARP